MQSAIERYLKDKNYPLSIVRSREFRSSKEILNARQFLCASNEKARDSTRPSHSHQKNRQLCGKKTNLTEQLGLRGRQEHYDAYEDLVVRQQEDGTEVVEFREGPTKTRSGRLTIRRRTTPQVMYSTDGGKTDPVRLFNLWLSQRPEVMKDTGPLYLSIINRPKSPDVLYTKVRMGENSIGNIMKSMASCLKTNKKLTNHSMGKTLVSKLKKSGQPRNVICEITGHARESSLDDFHEIDENQWKELSHIISGYKELPNENTPNSVANQNTANDTSNQEIAVQRQRAPLAPIHHVPQQGQLHQTMAFNPGFQPAGFFGISVPFSF